MQICSIWEWMWLHTLGVSPVHVSRLRIRLGIGLDPMGVDHCGPSSKAISTLEILQIGD